MQGVAVGFLDYVKFRFFSEKPNSTNRDKFVQFVDASGKPILIHKNEYRKNILPSLFVKEWNSPDSLYQLIIGTLDDGLNEECLNPARRLVEIDTNAERSHTVLGIALNKNCKYAEAEEFFKAYITKHGESAAMLCNLAKSYSFQNQADLAMQTLWRSLELDPNISNSVGWYAAIEEERGGKNAYLDALEKISKLPGSWHADLWIARQLIENGKLDEALARYSKAFRTSDNASEALFMASGDLGKNGHARKVVDLIAPLYSFQQHGYKPAMNLMQAYVELKDRENGLRLLRDLRALNRPDLITHLDYFDDALRHA
jgi:tetratricopeptide (TPR) repeat protein